MFTREYVHVKNVGVLKLNLDWVGTVVNRAAKSQFSHPDPSLDSLEDNEVAYIYHSLQLFTNYYRQQKFTITKNRIYCPFFEKEEKKRRI